MSSLQVEICKSLLGTIQDFVRVISAKQELFSEFN